MGGGARVFVDYWNFQLNWNERSNDARCNWLALPTSLIRAAEHLARDSRLSYEGTHIYASVDHQNDNLLHWLETFLERQPGFVVNTARMVRRQRAVRCASCGTEIAGCATCGEPYAVSTSKGLMTRMVCDMVALNASGACDVPIVVSSDTDLNPVLGYMAGRGVKVIHASWRDTGHDLARAAWASIDLDSLISELIRS